MKNFLLGEQENLPPVGISAETIAVAVQTISKKARLDFKRLA
jgi:hypothetical protein